MCEICICALCFIVRICHVRIRALCVKCVRYGNAERGRSMSRRWNVASQGWEFSIRKVLITRAALQARYHARAIWWGWGGGRGQAEGLTPGIPLSPHNQPLPIPDISPQPKLSCTHSLDLGTALCVAHNLHLGRSHSYIKPSNCSSTQHQNLRLNQLSCRYNLDIGIVVYIGHDLKRDSHTRLGRPADSFIV
jgi:hypothetical protein